MKKGFALLLAALTAVIFCACQGTPGPAETQAGFPIDRLVIGTTAQIETALNGEYAYDMLSSATTQLPLVWQDTEGAFHPLLASWKTEDAATWTFTVEPGMKWEDGTDVTAEDILFTLQYQDQSGSANLVDQTDADGKVTKAKYRSAQLSADKKSITLVLATPNIRELANMTSFRTLPKHIYEGKTALTEAEKRFGCGPYRFVSYSRNSGTITFAASETYPQQPRVRELVYRLFNNTDTMVLALQNGDIDMIWAYSTGVDAGVQDILDASDKVDLISVTAQNVPAVLAFNNARGPFADENLRRAVAGVLNYEQLRTYVGSKYSKIPNTGFVPTSTVGYKATAALKTDLPAAEAAMRAAGYSKNAAGRWEKNGELFAFTLTYRSDRANQVSCAELIKTAVEAFGGSVTLEGLDAASYNAKTSNTYSGNHITMEAALYGYTSAGMGMGNGLGSIYVDGNHAVQGGCQVFDPAFGAILTRMSEAGTIEAYTAAAGELQDYYAAHLPLVALYWDNLTYAVSSSLSSLTVDNVFGLNNVNNWMTVTKK